MWSGVFDATDAFFEAALEPGLKPSFRWRSSGGADNRAVIPCPSTGCRSAHHCPVHECVPARGPARSPALAAPSLASAFAVALALALVPTSARAGRQGDHDRARAAVQAGEVLPLPTLLERLQRTHPGQVLELELEREHERDSRGDPGRDSARDAARERDRAGQPGRWIYEVKLLRADGQLLKLEVDAATAQVLRVRGDGGGKRGRERREDREPRDSRDSREAREPPRAASERR